MTIEELKAQNEELKINLAIGVGLIISMGPLLGIDPDKTKVGGKVNATGAHKDLTLTEYLAQATVLTGTLSLTTKDITPQGTPTPTKLRPGQGNN